MAGHSHWAGIKRKKAITDGRRAKSFAKLIRGLEVAAREGGSSNPELNATLAQAVERAKQGSVPIDTINRACKRGAGELDDGVVYERIVYEGYGPSGVALLVETYTENRNRTGSDVKAIFARGGGNIGEPGSVAWMFERKGLVIVTGTVDEEELLLVAAEAGAEDVSAAEDAWEVTCPMTDFGTVRKAVADAGFHIESADLTMISTTLIPIDEEGARKVLRLMDTLEDHDDVQNVFPNFDAPPEAFED